jgi:hypothetical protein
VFGAGPKVAAVATALSLVAGIGSVAHANIISPSGVGAGNGNNAFPFNLGGTVLTAQRYEQIYGASDFGSSPLMITGMLFTPAASFSGSFSSTISNISIFLSTTTASVDGLSTNYNSNDGADNTQVFGGSLHLSSAGVPGLFDIAITFTTPFDYNPAQGNLLLDVKNFSGGTTTQFGDECTSGDTVSRLFNLNNDPTGAASGLTDTCGLVTEFVTGSVSVPEPSSLAVLAVGLLGFRFLRRKRA